MKHLATLIAAAAIAATVPFAANADSYINSKQQFKNFGAAHSVNKQAKSDRSKRTVTVTPASRGKSFNFGSLVRDTSREGYGPNGGR